MVRPPLHVHRNALIIKFLCSYGGKILPRYPDGKLRYHGGQTRLLSVNRSISFSELLFKLGEMCGTISVILRCQLPRDDLDALVSITSDEDLGNLIEEYDRESLSFKIRAFLSLPKYAKTISSSTSSSPTIPIPRFSMPVVQRCFHHPDASSYLENYRSVSVSVSVIPFNNVNRKSSQMFILDGDQWEL